MRKIMTVDDVTTLASMLGIDTKQKDDEVLFRTCPYCGGDREDWWKFAVNTESFAFHCFRANCPKPNGHFAELASDFDYELEDEEDHTEKRYAQQLSTRQPSQGLFRLPNQDGFGEYAREISREWVAEKLKARGISGETAERYGLVCMSIQQKSYLIIPHYDEKGRTVVTARMRDMDYVKGQTQTPKEKPLTAGTKQILFGMQCCAPSCDTLVITEGQLDALSLAECGVPNPISVPGGKQNFNWVNYNAPFLRQYKRLLVFGDNEGEEITLAKELKEKLKHITVLVPTVESYHGCKDCNEILVRFGKERATEIFAEMAQSAVESKLCGVVPANGFRYVRQSDKKRIELTEFPQLYHHGAALYFGELNVLGGDTGIGKSTVVSQIVVESVISGQAKALIFSPEMGAENVERVLIEQTIGRLYVDFSKALTLDGNFTDESVKKAKERLGENLFAYDDTKAEDEGENLSVMEVVENKTAITVKQYGVNFVVVDNLMMLVDQNGRIDTFSSQQNVVKRLKRLAKNLDIVVLLVAHSRKNSNGVKESDGTMIAGTADTNNLSALTLMFTKITQKDRAEYAKEYARMGDGFKRDFPEELGAKVCRKITIAKNRYGDVNFGIDGEYLTYNKQTRLSSPYTKYTVETEDIEDTKGAESTAETDDEDLYFDDGFLGW